MIFCSSQCFIFFFASLLLFLFLYYSLYLIKYCQHDSFRFQAFSFFFSIFCQDALIFLFDLLVKFHLYFSHFLYVCHLFFLSFLLFYILLKFYAFKLLKSLFISISNDLVNIPCNSLFPYLFWSLLLFDIFFFGRLSCSI